MCVLIFLDGYFVWGLVDMRKSFAAHGVRPDPSHIPVSAVIFLRTLRYIHHRLPKVKYLGCWLLNIPVNQLYRQEARSLQLFLPRDPSFPGSCILKY